MEEKMDSLARVFFKSVTARRPPLRLITGPDSTAAINGISLTLRQFNDAARGIDLDGPLIETVRAAVEAFFGDLTWAIDPAGLMTLFGAIADEIKNPGHLSQSVLNIGFGGSDEGVPLRSLAYVLPGLECLRKLQETGIGLPRLRIFSGQNMAVRCLGKDENLLWANTSGMFARIRLFAQRFYPTVANRLVFDFDRPLSHGDLERTLGKLVKELRGRARQDQEAAEALEILEGMAQAHGGDTESAALYGAAHPLAFGDILTDDLEPLMPFFVGETPDLMFVWGTRAEMKFFEVRRAIASQAARAIDKVRRIPSCMIITEIGKDKPPYYRHPRGDLGWLEAGQWASRFGRLPESVQRELETLPEATGGGPDCLIWWLKPIHEIFDVVDGTGPHAAELLAHSLLGSPVVRSGVPATDTIEAACAIADLTAPQEKELVVLARNEWMKI